MLLEKKYVLKLICLKNLNQNMISLTDVCEKENNELKKDFIRVIKERNDHTEYAS